MLDEMLVKEAKEGVLKKWLTLLNILGGKENVNKWMLVNKC